MLSSAPCFQNYIENLIFGSYFPTSAASYYPKQYIPFSVVTSIFISMRAKYIVTSNILTDILCLYSRDIITSNTVTCYFTLACNEKLSQF